MKYGLAIILALIVLVLSYIVFLPYLIMSFRFKAHLIASLDAAILLCEWVDNDSL